MKVTFAGAIGSALLNYANFFGVSSRAQYWYYFLFVALVGIVMSVLDSIFWPPVLTDDLAFDLASSLASAFTPLSWIASLVFLLPSLAVLSRRFRDAGWSGLWVLTTLLPVIPLVFLFSQMVNFGTFPTDQQILELAILLLLTLVVTLAVFIFQLVLCLLPTKSRAAGNRFAP
jgi:uncharacterized membrane protein YhaH (DUF805 family)